MAADPITASFTAVSALFGGLVVVDTPTYWSTFGEVAILVMIQVGGIGIMTLATLLGLLIARRVGLRLQLTAQAESKALGLGEVRSGRHRSRGGQSECRGGRRRRGWPLGSSCSYDEPLGRAMYLGVFHAVSAFNNAGFALFTDNMISFATDPWICLPLGVGHDPGWDRLPGVVRARPTAAPAAAARWSLHVRVTVITYAHPVRGRRRDVPARASGQPAHARPVDIAASWSSGCSTGSSPAPPASTASTWARRDPSTLLITDVLMFIGGGSAGTAGGIKVTTFALLAFVMLAEIRGEPTVHVLGRRLPAAHPAPGPDRRPGRVGLVMACHGDPAGRSPPSGWTPCCSRPCPRSPPSGCPPGSPTTSRSPGSSCWSP